MLMLTGMFLLLALVIVAAGTFLTRFSDRLADVTGLGRTLAGMLLLATATSLPELSIGCNAARMNAPNLTMGDLMGASLFNLMILAVLDLFSRTRGRMLSRTAAAHALSATVSVLLTAVALLFILLKVSWSVGPMGLGTLTVAATYLFCLRLVFFDQQYAISQDASGAEGKRAPGWRSKPALLAGLGYLAAGAVILAAAPRMAEIAKELADRTGLGPTFFGTAFVALVTSLPESVTTITALRMGASDLAIGNVFGSNSFNMAALVAIDAFYDGPLLASVESTHAVTAGAVIIATSVTILGLLYRAERRYWLIEPDAALVLVIILASFGLVYLL